MDLLLTSTLPIYAWVLIVAGAIVVALVVIFLVVFFLKRKKPTKVNDSSWLIALGGKDNIISISAIGSRINLTLKDKEIIDREKLKELGVKSVLVMSNKVTLVVETAAEAIANSVNASLDN